jgi:hypothetical protein
MDRNEDRRRIVQDLEPQDTYDTRQVGLESTKCMKLPIEKLNEN